MVDLVYEPEEQELYARAAAIMQEAIAALLEEQEQVVLAIPGGRAVPGIFDVLKKEDIAWGLSTSGNSPNVVKGIEAAQTMGISTIGMTGRGGRLAECADLVFAVPSDTTARIQETHITLGHILCDLMERKLYPDQFKNG